jgi:hypothetical protein
MHRAIAWKNFHSLNEQIAKIRYHFKDNLLNLYIFFKILQVYFLNKLILHG